MNRSAIAITSFLTLLLAACGGSNSGGQSAVNGCTDFTDATAPAASRIVNFGGGQGNAYNPKCLAIAAGQSVMFSGSFSAHPLQPGVAPSSSGSGSGNNPIAATSTGNTATFIFPTAGTYPYYCSVHQGVGMYGAVQVR